MFRNFIASLLTIAVVLAMAPQVQATDQAGAEACCCETDMSAHSDDNSCPECPVMPMDASHCTCPGLGLVLFLPTVEPTSTPIISAVHLADAPEHSETRAHQPPSPPPKVA